MPSFKKMNHGRPCTYCKRQMDRHNPRMRPTREHVIPSSHGGRIIVPSCIVCNEIKADMLPEVWEAFMLAYPVWWKISKYDLRKVRRAAFRKQAEAASVLLSRPAPEYLV